MAARRYRRGMRLSLRIWLAARDLIIWLRGQGLSRAFQDERMICPSCKRHEMPADAKARSLAGEHNVRCPVCDQRRTAREWRIEALGRELTEQLAAMPAGTEVSQRTDPESQC